ncbi:MAG: M23 family metallopeptidase, partial [Actinomycetota bacterium]|nr:M23 family metallopeptidase [Actinomycetota bacterium]
LDLALAARAAAVARFEELAGQTAALEARLGGVRADRQHQEGRLMEARDRLKRLAVARYVATPVAPVSDALEAPTIVDMSRRVAMLGAVVEADERRVLEYQSAARQVTDEEERLSDEVARRRAALAQAAEALQGADAGMVASRAQLMSGHAGGSLVLGGLTFPVAGRHTFADTFGAPRMFGTPFAHLHQGTDIFAAQGTPVVAIERGVLVRVGTDVLGGTKLWLVGAGGTRYFYAHLSAFALGVVEGKPVEAGEIVGFVGNTGNARGTPPHLHFEAHPDGGPAINPYPLLRLVDDAQQRLMPTPLPGAGR